MPIQRAPRKPGAAIKVVAQDLRGLSRTRAGSLDINPAALEWEQIGEDTSEAWYSDGMKLMLARDHTAGLRDGGRWHWTITEDGWTHESGMGFRSKAAALADLRSTLKANNPMAGMPGGSVKGCIKKMKRKKKPPRDAGAYCASIADSIEPGWRKNPDDLVVEAVQVGPDSYKLKVTGNVGRIAVRGYTAPIPIGLYDDSELRRVVEQSLTLNRAGGGGPKIPYATRRKVETAMADKLAELRALAANPGIGAYIIDDVEENPRKTSQRSVLPRKMGDTVRVEYRSGESDFQDRTLHVKKTRSDTYVLKVEGEFRVRFGNKAEALEDIAYFKEVGALPREKTSWANPSTARRLEVRRR